MSHRATSWLEANVPGTKLGTANSAAGRRRKEAPEGAGGRGGEVRRAGRGTGGWRVVLLLQALPQGVGSARAQRLPRRGGSAGPSVLEWGGLRLGRGGGAAGVWVCSFIAGVWDTVFCSCKGQGGVAGAGLRLLLCPSNLCVCWGGGGGREGGETFSTPGDKVLGAFSIPGGVGKKIEPLYGRWEGSSLTSISALRVLVYRH